MKQEREPFAVAVPRQRTSVRAPRHPPPACDMTNVTALSTNWAIVDRTVELSSIDVALRAGQGVVLSGPTGVGKTTLLETVRARFDDDSHSLVRAIGSASLARIPLAAFARFGRDSAAGVHDLLASIWRSLEMYSGKRCGFSHRWVSLLASQP